MKYFLWLVVMTSSVGILFSCGASAPGGELEWREGWVRALPTGSGMTAAYGELRNDSPETISLSAFDSDVFASVSLHQSTVENGVSRMREQSDVQIAPGEVLILEPGRLHLMLMRARQNVQVGDQIEITIHSGEKRYAFKLLVEAR